MTENLNISKFLEIVDVDNIHVYTPTKNIFVCGGKIDVKSETPKSFREAFMRLYGDGKFPSYIAILAEELNPFFPKGKYQDLLNLEEHIAQISELILLFSESYGSVAELGSFSVNDEIRQRLLVALDEENYNDNSFIRLGPIKVLENLYGDCAVCVLSKQYLEFASIDDLSKLDTNKFEHTIRSSIENRVKKVPKEKSFDSNIPGHLIKLVTGFTQIFGALRFDEINSLLIGFQVELPEDDLHNYLLCSEFYKWTKKQKRGNKTYYIAITQRKAIGYTINKDKYSKGKIAYESEIRDYWKNSEQDRFSLISEAMVEIANNG